MLVQDVIVGAIRAIEARADAVDSSETTRRSSKLGFTEARSIQDPTIGLQDLAALNWRQLAIDMITEFLPSTPCNPRVRTGAQLAVQKLQELMMYDADNVYASDLDAGLRVSLASALSHHRRRFRRLPRLKCRKLKKCAIRSDRRSVPKPSTSGFNRHSRGVLENPHRRWCETRRHKRR